MKLRTTTYLLNKKILLLILVITSLNIELQARGFNFTFVPIVTSPDTSIQYNQTEIEIMNNVAWEWRNAYNDVIYALRSWSNFGINGNSDNGMPSILNGQRHNPPVQHLYADYSISLGPERFYQLVCSSAYPDHPSNLTAVKQWVDLLRTNDVWNSIRMEIKSQFDHKEYAKAMWTALVNINDPNLQETLRATFRDNRTDFIALFN